MCTFASTKEINNTKQTLIQHIMTTNLLKVSAKSFLHIAEKFNNEVSAYLCGSNNKADINGYIKVKEAYRRFIKEYNAFYGEACDDSIDYDLAYSVL